MTRKIQPGAQSIRCFLLAVAVFGLAACASGPKTGKSAPGSYDKLMAEAESQVMSGRIDAAHITFDRAAQADPTRKEPWVRNAQLYFDAGGYGRAIVAAQEVLQRDPEDLVADSVLTVSGFRVATQSLQRLQGNGALASETARKEAQQLASVLRTTMGESILPAAAPKPVRRRPPAAPKAKTTVPAATPSDKPATAPSNPFDKLGGN